MATSVSIKLITQDDGKHDIQICVPDKPDFYLPENISESIREIKETQRQSQKGLTKREKEKLEQQELSKQEIEEKDIKERKQQMFEVAIKEYIMFAGIEVFRELAEKKELFEAQEKASQKQQQEEQRKKEKKERKKSSFRPNVTAFALGRRIGDSLFGRK
jgi:5-methylthioribose kinase